MRGSRRVEGGRVPADGGWVRVEKAHPSTLHPPPSDDHVCDVIVVGGGPAGAATATLLARAGIDVLVLDRARFPRAKACSEYLSPEASRLLALMGALEEVEGAGAARLAGMRVRAPNG